MASLDLTAKDLADRSGLSHTYVRGLISGTYSNKKGREKLEAAIGFPVWSDLENDLEQGTRQNQSDDLPLRSDVISAGEAADIQRPTAALLPVSKTQQGGE